MCDFNSRCSVSDGSCKCMRYQAQGNYYKLLNFSQPQSINTNLLNSLFQAVTRQGELISNINNSLAAIQQAIPLINPQNSESTTPSMLVNLLNSEKNDFSHFIRLLTAPPKPVYKERAFTFSVKIIDHLGEISSLSKSLILELSLFTSESPPKKVELNTSGQKVLKYICDYDGQSFFCFKKVFVHDVTSHYRNGSLMLIVTSNFKTLKPLIIEDFIVKARKIPSKCCEESYKRARLN